MANRRIKRKQGKQKQKIKLLSDKERSQLLRETRELVNESNRRLRSIYRVYGRGRFAGKRVDVLKVQVRGSVNSQGLIKINKYMSDYELMTIKKEAQQLISKKTSTLRGIERYKRRKAREMEFEYEDFDSSKLSDEDYDTFETFFDDRDVIDVFRYIDPSTLQSIIEKANIYGWSEKKFIDVINTIVDTTTDDDLRDGFIRIYRKFVG